MKQTIMILLLAVIAGSSTYAQCEKKSVITSGLTEYLTSTGEVRKSVEEATTIEFDSKTITIAPGDHIMDGTVTSTTCEWKTPYKEGKTVIKATIAAGDRNMDVTITIEGKDGKVVLLFEETADMRIRITADKFEERK